MRDICDVTAYLRITTLGTQPPFPPPTYLPVHCWIAYVDGKSVDVTFRHLPQFQLFDVIVAFFHALSSHMIHTACQPGNSLAS